MKSNLNTILGLVALSAMKRIGSKATSEVEIASHVELKYEINFVFPDLSLEEDEDRIREIFKGFVDDYMSNMKSRLKDYGKVIAIENYIDEYEGDFEPQVQQFFSVLVRGDQSMLDDIESSNMIGESDYNDDDNFQKSDVLTDTNNQVLNEVNKIVWNAAMDLVGDINLTGTMCYAKVSVYYSDRLDLIPVIPESKKRSSIQRLRKV